MKLRVIRKGKDMYRIQRRVCLFFWVDYYKHARSNNLKTVITNLNHVNAKHSICKPSQAFIVV